MVIVPNSKVKLIKNPLKLDSNNEMMFDNATAQYNYFTSLPKLEFDNLTYVRKDDILRIPTDETGVGVTYEKLLQYNFCMYQNTYFGNKWFYAFIDDIKWINPSLTEVHLKTAYYQTWQFDLVFANSFIEREHVNDDTIGLHTIPEGLETGDYIQQIFSSTYIDQTPNYLSTYYFVVALSDWPYDVATPPNNFYNGLFSGFRYLAFENDAYLYNFLVDIQDESGGDPIGAIFVVPQFITGLDSEDFEILVTGKTWKAAWVPETLHAITMSSNIRVTDVKILGNNYTPKNNKLLCYPYRCIVLNNNAGSSMEYRYEWFFNKNVIGNNEACEFRIKGIISPGCGIKIYPLDYNETAQKTGEYRNFMYSMDGGKLPTCSWWNDAYTNWLTQNAVNMPLQALGNVFNIGKSAFTGNVGGAVSGLMGIGQQVGEIYSHSLEPATGKGGVNQGDINCSDNISYKVYRMSIRDEYAKVIDDFFTQFGYKVNRLGTPHLHVRTYFDYIKTIDINIEGNVPETDLEEIRKMFNNGIRFWHNTSYYLNFNVNNTIIS